MPKFITSHNIEIDLELASVGDRILATIIDLLIMSAYAVLMGIIAAGTDAGSMTVFILCIPLMFYSLLFEMFGQGQSPGKRSRDIKVVKLDGSSPTLSAYLLRWIFRLLDIFIFYGGVGLLSMITTRNTQRLGDLVAGTAVIKVRDIGSAKAFKIPEPDYKVQHPEVKILTEEQVHLLRKAVKMYHDHQNSDAVEQLSLKLKEKLNVSSNLSHLAFLETIIQDYDHISLN